MSIEDLRLNDTIIAIATPPGQGALAVIRLSGPESLSVAEKIFRSKTGQGFSAWRLIQGWLINWERNEYFDEATAVYFPAPRSYTREEMVEIICHGSPVILEEAVHLGLKAGARLAHPGEFTLRAYLHGRLDLLQAEAVNDLIRATSLRQARLSFRQLEGHLSRKIQKLRETIVNLLSLLEAAIEFPEEGLNINVEEIRRKISEVKEEVKQLIQSYDLGKTLVQGVKLAIVGRANAGKSTLFNALLERERAIVSPHPGTTRDYIEERIKIKDVLFTLVDMAGFGLPAHPLEEEGIRRAKTVVSEAYGLLVIFDNSQVMNQADEEILALAKAKKSIFILNKIDLPPSFDKEKLRLFRQDQRVVEISALHRLNLNNLKEAIFEVFSPGNENDKEEVIFHWREKAALEKIYLALDKSLMALEAGYSEEIIAEEVRQVGLVLGQLTGEIQSEEIINSVFSEFCVGK